VTQKAQPLVPIPPEGVRIVRRDGIEIPCEVKYVGVETGDDGEPMHEWRAVSEYMPNIEAGANGSQIAHRRADGQIPRDTRSCGLWADGRG